MKLQFLLCGSPTDGFFSQMAFFRLCLSELGSHYASAQVIAVFGDHHVESIAERWQPYLRDVEIHWAHPPGAANPDHVAQHDKRFELLDPDADACFICDADVAILNPMEELLTQLRRSPALSGVIAHYHFPWGQRPRNPEVDWPEISRAIIGKDIERSYRYTLMPLDAPKSAPFYINYGVLAGAPALMRAFHRRDLEIRQQVADLLGHWWAPQVSLALACADLGLPVLDLPMRYNFPNDPIADRLYPSELGQIVFLHYLRHDRFRRDEIFADPRAFQAFLSQHLAGSNDVFQRFVLKITSGTFPFPG